LLANLAVKLALPDADDAFIGADDSGKRQGAGCEGDCLDADFHEVGDGFGLDNP
jgi:hypothetical protein